MQLLTNLYQTTNATVTGEKVLTCQFIKAMSGNDTSSNY